MSTNTTQAKPSTALTKPLVERIKLLTMNARFAWWFGHVIVTISSLVYLLKRPFSYDNSKPWYYIAYLGALLSYGITLWKTHGIPQINGSLVQKIIGDENAQYFIMAIIWLLSSPVFITLIPFGVYSSFHVVDFIRTAILPTFVPSVAQPPVPGQPRSIFQQASDTIKRFKDVYYEKCMGIISYIEVLGVMSIILTEALTFNISPLAVLFYGNFLRLRYATSPHIRNVFGELRNRMDKWMLPPTANPKIPAFVGNGYTVIRDGLISLTKTEKTH
ncbi:Transmembrane nucleoporin [Basidiobolus ranarum]|uniref:Transmembrane nucleoporin n=1 Tax=Basidiobolus ranarum TaxID=34480 RepID=A0ABR2WA86_9FUNG